MSGIVMMHPGHGSFIDWKFSRVGISMHTLELLKNNSSLFIGVSADCWRWNLAALSSADQKKWISH